MIAFYYAFKTIALIPNRLFIDLSIKVPLAGTPLVGWSEDGDITQIQLLERLRRGNCEGV